MPIAADFLDELASEMPNTRRVIERVPMEKAEWKPHPKSFALGHLAQLVSWMPGWIANTAKETTLDLATAPKYSWETSEALLKGFDQNVKDAREALEKMSDADFAVVWSLKHGPANLFSSPRSKVIRNHISHLSHHRGQLTVYLRLLEVPVPCVYGPTADEKPW